MFQTIVVFECRGIEPVDFDPRVGLNIIRGVIIESVLCHAGWLECPGSGQ